MAKQSPDETPEDRGNQDNDGTPPAPPGKRARIRLQTIQDVRRALARLFREGHSGKRDVGDVSKLSNTLAILGRLIEGSELADRIARLEEGTKR